MCVRDTDGREKDAFRTALLERMERLAGGRVNDAVKLAFLDSERMDEIDRLDLSALTEFKRSGNGTVEIKLTDRLAALEKLLAMLEGGENAKAEAFYQALEGGAKPREDG